MKYRHGQTVYSAMLKFLIWHHAKALKAFYKESPSAEEIRQELMAQHGVSVSQITIRKHLQGMKSVAYRRSVGEYDRDAAPMCVDVIIKGE